MKDQSEPLLLNLGCGANHHPNWTNLDLVPVSPLVIKADLSRGIPFADGSAQAVYHSHVLEHLPRPAAREFVAECHRVLQADGILRIAVPDLEQIASQYLETIYRAWQDPSKHSLANHHWMQLEMLDQIVRKQSGGDMGLFMSNPDIPNADFVNERLGNQFQQTLTDAERESPVAGKKSWWRVRLEKTKRRIIRLLFGKAFLKHLDEFKFRESGEIHHWMYDRVSLRQLLSEAGFVDFQVCRASESRIQDFSKYGLDARRGAVLKPDSIFVEARKPGLANAAAA